MTDRNRFCALILAAGASSRMGHDKALLAWPPASETGTLLSAAIQALQPFAETIIVVAGNNADTLAPMVAQSGASLVRNPAPERGQFSSLQTGLRAALDQGCEAAIITPVDCPPLGTASLEKTLRRIRAGAHPRRLGRGTRARRPPRPSLFASRDLMEALLSAPTSSNAREVNSAHADKFEYVALPDVSVARDMNSPEEYAALAEEMGL